MDACNSPGTSKSECWQCGRPADPKATYTAVLVAATKRGASPLGFPVKTRGSRDEVRVPVPRCRACQVRTNAIIFKVLLSTAFGAIVAPASWAIFGTHGGPLPWWSAGNNPNDIMVILGVLVGFMGALLRLKLRYRKHGFRSINAYPPIAALRAQGWDWPLE